MNIRRANTEEDGIPEQDGHWSFWCVVLVLLETCCACSRQPPTSANGPPGAPVTVASAIVTNVPVQLQAIGHVSAFASVAVQSQVDGVLEAAHFQEGSLVKAGELIFTLDARPFQAAVNQAKADLEKDLALAQYAEFNARQTADLFEQGIVAQDTNVESQAALKAAQATVDADRAAVTNAELQLSYCSIRAPITGRVGTLLINPGNVVKNLDTVLAVLKQTEPIYVDFSVPEKELPAIRASFATAGKLAVRVKPSGAGPPALGHLAMINNMVDTNTGAVLLRAEVPNRDERLWPGEFVNVSLTVKVLTKVVVVPVDAVQIGQQGKYVFTVDSQEKAEVRPVQTGPQAGADVVVLKGLHPGEPVVVSGQVRLAPGTRVQIQAPAAAPPPSESGGGAGASKPARQS